MLRPLTDFSRGFFFHAKGIRFGLQNGSFLLLSILPFLLTWILYIFIFYLFNLYMDDILESLWDFNPEKAPEYIGWLHSIYLYVVRYLLYLIALIIMFYSFILLANIIASPFYDYISDKYQRTYHPERVHEPDGYFITSMLRIMKEELKKAVFMLMIPLFLLFIPILGTFLAFIVAGIFLAWDFTDFSLSRDYPLFKDRIKAVWEYKFYFLGFGIPLMIPLVNLVMIPFAILGATKLYYDELKKYPMAKAELGEQTSS